MRRFTLKQLRDLINEIYEEKEKHDKKCKESGLPLETLEQYMYTFLYYKYGLKTLILEWAAAIVNGIKMYKDEDPEVALFAKLLKNECEEDFRIIQASVKDLVEKIIRRLLREKYIHKTEPQLNEAMKKLENDVIPESMWKRVLEEIFE